MTNDERLDWTRTTVVKILRGEITRETDPILFRVDDDAFFHALMFLQHRDPGWLEAQLADERYPREARELLESAVPHDPDDDKDPEEVRAYLLRVLRQEVPLVDDDTLFEQLLYLMIRDLEWLRAQLANETYSKEARDFVTSVMPRED